MGVHANIVAGPLVDEKWFLLEDIARFVGRQAG